MKKHLCAALVAVATIFSCLQMGADAAQNDTHLMPNPWAGKLTIVYGPASPKLQPIRDMLIKAQVLERLQRFLSPLRLKKDLVVQTAECGSLQRGEYYAFVPYVPGKPVTLCYEFVQVAQIFAPYSYDLLAGQTLVSREMAIEGPIAQEVLHDVALALFDQLDIPVWGREEDAADNVAAMSMMYFGKDVALKSVLGSAYFLKQLDDALTAVKNQNNQVVGHSYSMRYLAGIRPPLLQRYYNLLCMAVGNDPITFSGLIAFPPNKPTDYTFSWDKAQECQGVYHEAADGFKRLILDKYVDQSKLAQIKNVNWFARP